MPKTTLSEKFLKILEMRIPDKRKIPLFLEAVREELPEVKQDSMRTMSHKLGQDHYRTAVLKVLEGR